MIRKMKNRNTGTGVIKTTFMGALFFHHDGQIYTGENSFKDGPGTLEVSYIPKEFLINEQ